ncbi:MAG TPA: helix-turn-helix domain-containing protein [Pedococcus sp.]|nr:helix-turn-helix domain-containing protein [Pedococcus sp.]
MTTDQAGLGPTRTRVLRVLRDADAPLGAAEVADRLGVHTNSARFHLEALVGSGMVERAAEDRSARGRPKVLYAVSPRLPAEDGGWRELATILTQALATPAASPALAAEVAGEAHGRALAAAAAGTRTDGAGAAGSRAAGNRTAVTRPAGSRVPGTGAAAPVVVADGLRRLGFESSAHPTRAGGRIDIRPCPFLGLARTHGDVVCGVHRGLLSGMLAELDPSLTLDRLEPFAGPDLCVARIGRA